jgi:hypothetical protein
VPKYFQELNSFSIPESFQWDEWNQYEEAKVDECENSNMFQEIGCEFDHDHLSEEAEKPHKADYGSDFVKSELSNFFYRIKFEYLCIVDPISDENLDDDSR